MEREKSWNRLAAVFVSVCLCLETMWGCGTKEETGAEPVAQMEQASEEDTAAEDAALTESIGEIMTFPLPQTSEESEIFLAPIPDISDDFIRGMDASAVLAEEKSGALYDFTKESLAEILDAGVDVGMVQIGNEINNGMAGEKKMTDVAQLLHAGSRAVRETADAYDREIKVAVHYTDIHHEGSIEGIAADLEKEAVDYDIFAFSYYPFWHGDRENMQAVAKMLQEKFGKQVVIAETSYCYTSEDGDGSGNSVNGVDDLAPGYGATVQGQATMIRDICEAANEAGVLGIFYWEGTWIPVGKTKAENSPIWEEFGSGWASSYAKEYDPNDAGKYYGGCSWDNQAMFDFEGHPLSSLNVFKYLKYGATAPSS